eukprot:125757_1
MTAVQSNTLQILSTPRDIPGLSPGTPQFRSPPKPHIASDGEDVALWRRPSGNYESDADLWRKPKDHRVRFNTPSPKSRSQNELRQGARKTESRFVSPLTRPKARIPKSSSLSALHERVSAVSQIHPP